MTQVMPSTDSIWAPRDQVLPFRFGPLEFARVRFRACSLQTPFIELPRDLDQTVVTSAELGDYEAAVILGHPVDVEPRWINVSGGLLRYCSFSEIRYLVELDGTFDGYLQKFTAKRRGNLLRTIKKFSEFAAGTMELRHYFSSMDMPEFQRIAVDISRKTYQSRIGFGFQDNDQFLHEITGEAGHGRVRGYVLYCKGSHAAYIFCRMRNSTMFYTHIGYDPDYGDYSPGTVALYMLLEELFQERRYSYLDFLGGEYWQYKQVYSTLQVRSVTVFYIRKNLKNSAIVTAHAIVRRCEEMAVRVKRFINEKRKKKA